MLWTKERIPTLQPNVIIFFILSYSQITQKKLECFHFSGTEGTRSSREVWQLKESWKAWSVHGKEAQTQHSTRSQAYAIFRRRLMQIIKFIDYKWEYTKRYAVLNMRASFFSFNSFNSSSTISFLSFKNSPYSLGSKLGTTLIPQVWAIPITCLQIVSRERNFNVGSCCLITAIS